MKMPKFGNKNVSFCYFWARILKTIVIFEVSTLKFVMSESLTDTGNFSKRSAFFKGLASVFSEGPGSGRLYKVFR